MKQEKKPKIVILRGGAGTGKSTAFENLKRLKKDNLKEWVFIDHPSFKGFFNYLEDKNELQKKALWALMKELIKTKKNIILEEMSAKNIKKHLGYYLRKHNYKIIVLQFEVSNIDLSYKRIVQRVKRKEGIHTKVYSKKFVLDTHEMHKKKFDSEGISINTTKLGKRQVVEFILNKIK